MSYLESRFSMELMDIHVERIQRASETRQLLRRAGLVRPGWLHKKRCLLLCWLAHILVSMGERLEQRALARTLSFGEEMSPGS